MKKIIFFILVGLLTAETCLALPLPELIPKECRQGGECGLCQFFQTVINASDIILALTGIMAVVMFVYGGFTMIIAYGNEQLIERGKKILIATVIGIGIVLLAWTFVHIVIQSITGGDFNNWWEVTC